MQWNHLSFLFLINLMLKMFKDVKISITILLLICFCFFSHVMSGHNMYIDIGEFLYAITDQYLFRSFIINGALWTAITGKLSIQKYTTVPYLPLNGVY